MGVAVGVGGAVDKGVVVGKEVTLGELVEKGVEEALGVRVARAVLWPLTESVIVAAALALGSSLACALWLAKGVRDSREVLL